MQNENQVFFSGSSFLANLESVLHNYNTWTVETFLKSIPAVKKNTRVLDFGAGIGALSTIFETKTGIKPEGLEIDPAQKEILLKRGFKVYSSVDEIDGKFDIIFTSNVLEHIEDDVATLVQLHKKLNDQGLLAIYVPAYKILWSSLDSNFGHYRRYRKLDLSIKLEQSGFTICDARYCDSIGFILALLFRIIGNRSGEPSIWSLRFFDKYLVPVSRKLDLIVDHFFGKNVFILARKDNGTMPN